MELAAALLLMLQGGGAPGTLNFDVRCLVATGQLIQSQDQTLRRAGEVASQFYFGRIDSRVPDSAIEETIWRETRGMRAEERAQLLQACGTYMQQRGQRLTEIGNQISVREQAGTRH